MADSPAFNFVCEQLEERTSLDRLEARGTVRLALKDAGLAAGEVTPDQIRAVLQRVMPGELRIRGVESPDALCGAIGEAVCELVPSNEPDSPEAVFARLGGSPS